LARFHGRRRIFDEKRWDQISGFVATDIFRQVQIAHVHVDEKVVAIAKFSKTATIWGWTPLVGKFSQHPDFIINNFGLHAWNSYQFPRERLT